MTPKNARFHPEMSCWEARWATASDITGGFGRWVGVFAWVAQCRIPSERYWIILVGVLSDLRNRRNCWWCSRKMGMQCGHW